jgi:outer membrane protein assembly factor BamB
LAGEFLRRRGKEATPKYLWQDQQNYRFTSLVVGQQALLAAGHQEATPQHSKLLAIDIETGATLWSVDLPAATVKSGLAMDSNGSVYAALENGELHCWKVKN